MALTAPGSVFSVGGSPVTTSGTLALSLATQSPNQVWAGPVSGGAATPAFRALDAADIGTGIVSIAAINSKRGTGTFVQIAASGTAGAAGDVVTFDATGNTVDSGTLLSSLAPLASPTLTGVPAAPTASALTSSTQIATTAYADAAVAVETARAETAEATKPVLSDGAGNPPSSGDNHIASGTGAITAGGNVTLSLSGAAAFTDTNYVVQVTRTNAVTGIGQLYAVPISGTQFSVSSSDHTDTTSTFAWTAIGF